MTGLPWDDPEHDVIADLEKAGPFRFSQTPSQMECPERKGETHHLIPRRIHGTASTELACVYCRKTEKQLREEQS